MSGSTVGARRSGNRLVPYHRASSPTPAGATFNELDRSVDVTQTGAAPPRPASRARRVEWFGDRPVSGTVYVRPEPVKAECDGAASISEVLPDAPG